MSGRQIPSLGPPPADPAVLGDGPVVEVDCELARVSRSIFGSPWYFDCGDDGRFNLDAGTGEGTCYWANDAIAATREVLGPDFRAGSVVPRSFFEARQIWRVEPADNGRPLVAPLNENWWAGHGLTVEVTATTDYTLPRKWAAAFRSVGFDGIRHNLRHVLDLSMFGISLFGGQDDDEYPGFDDASYESFSNSFLADFTNQTQIQVEPSPVPSGRMDVIR